GCPRSIMATDVRGSFLDADHPATGSLFHAGSHIAGTRLIREWQGVEHVVTVTADGFEWQGRPYKSLSAIARAITGTRWNGLVFFGLKNRRRRT
ncbi:DUF2924 domain-containing protein, partial [Wenxinia saemankumensis]